MTVILIPNLVYFHQFAVILTLVLVLEIAAAIAAYSLRGQISGMLDENLRASMPEYYEDPVVRDYFDFMQSRVSCEEEEALL